MKPLYILALFFTSTFVFSQADHSVYLGTGLSSAKKNYGKVISVHLENDFVKFLVIDIGYSFLNLKYGEEKAFKIHKLSLLTGKNFYFSGKNFCISPRIGPSFSIFETDEPQNFKSKTAMGADLGLGLSFRLFYGVRIELSDEININTNKKNQTIFCVGLKCVF